MYLVSKVNDWNASTAFHAATLDFALIMAEIQSLMPEVGTSGVLPKVMVWTWETSPTSKNVKLYDVKAIAMKGVARMMTKCQNESKWCNDCDGFGWKESGKDRG